MSETTTQPSMGEIHTTGGDYHTTDEPALGKGETIIDPRPVDYHTTGDHETDSADTTDTTDATDDQTNGVAAEADQDGEKKVVTKPVPGRRPFVVKDYHTTSEPVTGKGTVVPKPRSADHQVTGNGTT